MRFTEDLFRAHQATAAPDDVDDFNRLWPLPSACPGFDYSSGFELFGADWCDRSANSFPGNDPSAPKLKDGLKIVPVLAFTRQVPSLRFDREWLAIRHNCGGHTMDQVSMIATRLRPRALMADALLQIARDRYYEADGWYSRNELHLSFIVEYSAALNALGLDCEVSWPLLQEGTYPIDATPENLDRLAEGAPDLGAIADWVREPPGRYSSDPVILLLTNYCG